ncbi:hypothetical protein ARMGADRAFT_1019511 [Armillaria gallica]|uniref:Uncharacterized protein n=1 Tax=Armillaria gallica TaxID=47427 RepID=A0A2H3D143_ARMGA|nr:hypothetical protein ARMGADRAFT_1019511 [Armillaria gallica]
MRSPPSLSIGSGHHRLLTIPHLSLTPLVSTITSVQRSHMAVWVAGMYVNITSANGCLCT